MLEFDEIDPRGERFRYHIENGYGILLCEKDGEIELRCPNAHKLRGQRTQAELADEVYRCAQCHEEAERKAKEKGRSCDQNAGTFRVRDRLNPLAVSWPALFKNMQHTHCVLEAMHKYLVETYFQNDEWEGEQNSW